MRGGLAAFQCEAALARLTGGGCSWGKERIGERDGVCTCLNWEKDWIEKRDHLPICPVAQFACEGL
jgi:hypothetical protein